MPGRETPFSLCTVELFPKLGKCGPVITLESMPFKNFYKSHHKNRLVFWGSHSLPYHETRSSGTLPEYSPPCLCEMYAWKSLQQFASFNASKHAWNFASLKLNDELISPLLHTSLLVISTHAFVTGQYSLEHSS